MVFCLKILNIFAKFSFKRGILLSLSIKYSKNYFKTLGLLTIYDPLINLRGKERGMKFEISFKVIKQSSVSKEDSLKEFI